MAIKKIATWNASSSTWSTQNIGTDWAYVDTTQPEGFTAPMSLMQLELNQAGREAAGPLEYLMTSVKDGSAWSPNTVRHEFFPRRKILMSEIPTTNVFGSSKFELIKTTVSNNIRFWFDLVGSADNTKVHMFVSGLYKSNNNLSVSKFNMYSGSTLASQTSYLDIVGATGVETNILGQKSTMRYIYAVNKISTAHYVHGFAWGEAGGSVR